MRARAAPALADEEPTVRVLLRETAGTGLPAPAPPPPSASSANAQTPTVLEIPKRHAATLRRLLGERYAQIGIVIFAVGVLVADRCSLIATC